MRQEPQAGDWEGNFRLDLLEEETQPSPRRNTGLPREEAEQAASAESETSSSARRKQT